ncbi:MAG TPA: organomercurial lyase [Nitrospiria bacterium]|nr:organomercurial lyase [Nitrospiria bacterium]
MAGKSRWKVESTNRAQAALGAAKTLLQREQRLAQLTEAEREAWRYLIAAYPERGRAAYAEEIQSALNWDDLKAAEQAIAHLEQLDLIALQGGLVATVYPYSVNPTLHEVHFPSKPEWQPVYAASAIDALGVSSLVEQEVAVESKCAYCDAPIHVGLKGGELVEAKPEAMRLWVGNQPPAGGARAAAAFSDGAVFACSDQHLAAWRGRAGQREGFLLTLGEAAYVAKGLYAGLLPSG